MKGAHPAGVLVLAGALAVSAVAQTVRKPVDRRANAAWKTPTASKRLFSDQSVLLLPGMQVEANFAARAGEVVTARFTCEGGPVVWDSHHHLSPAPEDTLVYERGAGEKGVVSVRAPFDGSFSFLFVHGGAATATQKLNVKLYGEARLEGWDFR